MSDFKIIKTHIRHIMGCGLLIYIFAVVCFYFSAIMPIKKQLGFMEQKTTGLEQTVEQLKSEYVTKWEQEKEGIFKIIDLFQQKEYEKNAVLSKFFQISRDFGVDVEKTEPLGEEDFGDTIAKYSWKISCYADYPALGAFFNEIEKSPLFLCVESPTILSKAERLTKKHKADFLLSTYRLKIKK